jgi:predicted O-linked N-acetylglucosamine transferase (SPINDLY family)
LKAIDYFLTDPITTPAESDHLFSEAPWRLPVVSFPYRPAEGMGEVGALPALRNGFVTFGTLTRSIRVNHHVIRVWSAILNKLPNAKLIINSKSFLDEQMQDAVAEKFSHYGISRDRLLIGFDSPPWEVVRQIDICLDCFPHNSGTTLVESLYMGVPYITLAGRPSVGRLGASILQAIGRSEWVAGTEEDYIDKAILLASDLANLSAIRAGLRDRLQCSELMNETNFAQNVEKAYGKMLVKWCRK